MTTLLALEFIFADRMDTRRYPALDREDGMRLQDWRGSHSRAGSNDRSLPLLSRKAADDDQRRIKEIRFANIDQHGIFESRVLIGSRKSGRERTVCSLIKGDHQPSEADLIQQVASPASPLGRVVTMALARM